MKNNKGTDVSVAITFPSKYTKDVKVDFWYSSSDYAAYEYVQGFYDYFD